MNVGGRQHFTQACVSATHQHFSRVHVCVHAGGGPQFLTDPDAAFPNAARPDQPIKLPRQVLFLWSFFFFAD